MTLSDNQSSQRTFTVTTGRSGSTYLAHLLSGLRRTLVDHEPKPNFVSVMRKAQQMPEVAAIFWAEQKLPTLKTLPCDHYIETSHVFCKGFFEPLIENHFIPNLIVLRRSARQIANSMVGLETIPGRTEGGLKWYLQPVDPVLVSIDDWYSLSDYQLCYWYCLEVEARAQRYANIVRERGGRVSEVSLDGLRNGDDFLRLIKELALPSLRFNQLLLSKIKRRMGKNASIKSREQTNDRASEEAEILARADVSGMDLAHFLR